MKGITTRSIENIIEESTPGSSLLKLNDLIYISITKFSPAIS